MLNREELKKKFSSMLQEKAEGVVKGTVGKSMPWGMHELDTPDAVSYTHLAAFSGVSD